MKKTIIFILSLFPILLLRAGAFRLLFLTKFPTDQIVITNLLDASLTIPYWATALAGLINMFLIWLVAKNLFNNKTALICYLIYGISPWSAYLEYSASVYVVLTTLLLFLFYGLIVAKKGHVWGNYLAFAGILGLVYTSFLSWLFLPFLIWGIYKLGYLNIFKDRKWQIILLLFILPLMVLAFKNRQGLINTAKNQVTIFSDVGLINTVNVFQGENREVRPQIVARLTENRYSYSGLHFISSALTSLNPINYFAPEYKMFGFSLNPAILVGFIVPFFLGLVKLIKYLQKHLAGLAVFSLFIPSFLSKNSPDFARVFLLSPLIFLLVALGLNELISLKNKRWVYTVIFIVVIQFIIVLADIFIREPWRLYELTRI